MMSKKITGLVVINSGIHFHRIVNPFAYAGQGNFTYNLLHVGPQEQTIDCDILVFNKWCGTHPDTLKELQSQGLKIVVDIDDYWAVDPSHPNYKHFTESGIAEITLDNIRLADAVTCTTQRLAKEIEQYNKNVVVIPNALPFDRDQYKVGDRERAREISGNDKTRFMYLAGSTHKEDVDLLKGKFNRIGTDPYLQQKAEFILCGYEPTTQALYNSKEDIEQKNDNYTIREIKGVYDVMADVFRSTKSFKIYPSVGLEHYLNYYDSADVAIAPLKGTKWNSMKSELKIIEAGCKHIPLIASAVAPYTDVITFKQEGVMLAEKSDDWMTHIKYCVKNPSYATEMGERLYHWTKETYNLIKINKLREQLYTSL